MATDYSVYRLNGTEKRNFLITAYIGVFAVAYLFYDSMIISIAAGFVTPLWIKKYENYKCDKRMALLKTQFRDLLYSLSSSFSSGRHMAEALSDASENLEFIYGPAAPIVIETKLMASGIHEARESEERVIADFAARSHIRDIIDFADVYITCRTTGGDLEKAVMNTSRILMDKIEIDEEIRIMTVQKKFEGKIITIMPVAVIMFLRIASPEYLEIMYKTFNGRAIMTLALGAIGYACFLISKITDIEV